MSLVPHNKYEVGEIDLKVNQVRIAPPITWLRDNCQAGDKLIVNFDSDNPDRLVITVSKANSNGIQAGEEVK